VAGEHPIAAVRAKGQLVADEAYDVTPMVAEFRDIMNKVARAGFAPWQVGQGQSFSARHFRGRSGSPRPRYLWEYDLVYCRGERSCLGRPDSTAEALIPTPRPANLQTR